jgi:hypothetical protein
LGIFKLVVQACLDVVRLLAHFGSALRPFVHQFARLRVDHCVLLVLRPEEVELAVVFLVVLDLDPARALFQQVSYYLASVTLLDVVTIDFILFGTD